jgi:hypothetical protein
VNDADLLTPAEKFLAIVAGIGIALALTCVGAGIVWFLYNVVVVPCIPGLPKIGFWAVWGILGLLRLLSLVIRGK